MTDTIQKEPKKKKSPAQRWVKRIWNMIPSMKSLIKGAVFVTKKFLVRRWENVQKDIADVIDILKRTKRTLEAFSPHQIKTSPAKAIDCPLNECPIIIKIETLGDKGRCMHGAAAYKGIIVDSDGEGHNTTDDGRMEEPEDTNGQYFVIYPSRLGIDEEKLLQAMKQEAAKTGDYDFYTNNCIDHVIRPLQAAGVQIDLGEVSTPKELCQWCDNICCTQKAGYLLNEEEYQSFLNRIEEQNKNDMEQLYLISSLYNIITRHKPKQRPIIQKANETAKSSYLFERGRIEQMCYG